MKIKKAELRKGLAQLPINYPAPTVEDVFEYESEKHRVENLCKKLSHNEAEVRDAVLSDLPQYLKEVSESYHHTDGAKREDVELLLQKLCLGIFYCFWHSDKPLVQHECAFKISQLLFAPLSGEMQLLFVQAMFFILAKHWGKIDHYRMDKYLSLVRKMVFQMMSLCKVHHEKYLADKIAEGNPVEDTMSGKPASTELCSPQNNKIAPFAVQLCTYLQDKVLECPTSVGLTMHLMDLFLDELIRSDVPVDLFVYLSEQVPLFVMSKGNYVEKRVLDNFVTPVVSGVLDDRRVLTLSSSPDEEKRKAIEKKKAAAKKRGISVEALGVRDYSAENDKICIQLANCCRDFSVRRGTKFFVRSMFVESQKLLLRRLEVKLNPSDFKRLTKRDMQARIADEIREQEEIADKTMLFRKLIKDDFKKDKLDAKKIMKKAYSKRVREEAEEAEAEAAAGSDNEDGNDKKKPNAKRNKKKRVEKEAKSTLSKKEQRALKKKGPVAEVVEEKEAPQKKGKAKKAPKDDLDQMRPGVKKQLEKMKKKAELMDARKKKINAGERESKVSVKGIKQSSKRSKYVKMTTRDILEEAARTEAEDAGPPPTRY